MTRYLILVIMLFAAPLIAGSRHDQSACPDHDKHMAGVQSRGDVAMGFDHTKTTHHFLLKSNGGIIEVEANDPKDTASIEQIRGHFLEIARLFKEGKFDLPFFIHGKKPPGVADLKRLKSEIDYKAENTETGGRVIISTQNAEALSAIHDFLRFQITDHHTGDTLDLTP